MSKSALEFGLDKSYASVAMPTLEYRGRVKDARRRSRVLLDALSAALDGVSSVISYSDFQLADNAASDLRRLVKVSCGKSFGKGSLCENRMGASAAVFMFGGVESVEGAVIALTCDPLVASRNDGWNYWDEFGEDV